MVEPKLFTDHSEAVSCLRQELQQAVVEGAFIRAVDFGVQQDYATKKMVWRVYVRRGQPL